MMTLWFASCAVILQVKIEKPTMRIPMLAIHLNRDISTKGFELNKQTHLVPVLASAVKKAANKAASNRSSGEADGNNADANGQNKRQKVDGAGDAADLTPRTAKVSPCQPHEPLACMMRCIAMVKTLKRSLEHMLHHKYNAYIYTKIAYY